jgi:hypothetical protein
MVICCDCGEGIEEITHQEAYFITRAHEALKAWLSPTKIIHSHSPEVKAHASEKRQSASAEQGGLGAHKRAYL